MKSKKNLLASALTAIIGTTCLPVQAGSFYTKVVNGSDAPVDWSLSIPAGKILVVKNYGDSSSSVPRSVMTAIVGGIGAEIMHGQETTPSMPNSNLIIAGPALVNVQSVQGQRTYVTFSIEPNTSLATSQEGEPIAY